MDAAVSGATIAVADTAASTDYPDFGRIARRRGITHILSIGLPVQQQTTGALNIYGSGGNPFDAETREVASAFAGYAAVAVANVGAYARAQNLARNLQRALQSRAVIEQAKGILMAQRGISAEAAFELLSMYSQTSNRKLRDIARDIVAAVQQEEQS